MKNLELVWKDRKRIAGLPITFTKYAISEDRLFVETGLLNMKQEELLLYRVRDITLKISLGQRIFGVGTVVVVSSDRTTPTLELQNIKQPREVKELLHTQVEEMKIARRMRFGELLEDAGTLDDDSDLDDTDMEE